MDSADSGIRTRFAWIERGAFIALLAVTLYFGAVNRPIAAVRASGGYQSPLSPALHQTRGNNDLLVTQRLIDPELGDLLAVAGRELDDFAVDIGRPLRRARMSYEVWRDGKFVHERELMNVEKPNAIERIVLALDPASLDVLRLRARVRYKHERGRIWSCDHALDLGGDGRLPTRFFTHNPETALVAKADRPIETKLLTAVFCDYPLSNADDVVPNGKSSLAIVVKLTLDLANE